MKMPLPVARAIVLLAGSIGLLAADPASAQPPTTITQKTATPIWFACGSDRSPIVGKYEALGGPQGILGQPTTPEGKTPDGIGCFRHFEHGSIYFSPQTGSHDIESEIRDKWAALGWEKSQLGYPTTDETKTPDGVGRFNHFQGGSIYWSPSTGAHEVHGAIVEKWASLGWERSALGYPKTDEGMTPDGVGRFGHFQGGSIYWTPTTGAHEVHGAIVEKWASLGWEQSLLGYPTTDESVTPDGVGRFNHFRSGSIYWTPETGAQEVHGWIRDKWASLGWERSCLGYPTGDRYFAGGKWKQDFRNGTITEGKAYACGCFDWGQPPPGIVAGLKHSTNQAYKQLVWDGSRFDAASNSGAPSLFIRQNGGDRGGGSGEGYYWYETTGEGFEFPEDARTWHNLQVYLPSGLVLGLKHSLNQHDKTLTWLPSGESSNWTPRSFDPASDTGALAPRLLRQHGGDLGASEGEGFSWYEVAYEGGDDTCTNSLPGGLVFGLKHSNNQPAKKFRWRGETYDAADRGGPRPSGFARCHGGDLGAGEGAGFYWFETMGSGSSEQVQMVSCETQPWAPDFVPKIQLFSQTVVDADKARLEWRVESGPSCTIRIVGGINFDNLPAIGNKEIPRGCIAGGWDYEFTLIVRCGKNEARQSLTVPRSCPGAPTPALNPYCFKATQASVVTSCFAFCVAAPNADAAKQLAQAYASNATVTEITQAQFSSGNACK